MDTLKYIAEVIFQSLRNTNKVLFVSETSTEVFDTFIEMYPHIGQRLVIGPQVEDTELSIHRSCTTHLDTSLADAFFDHSLNSPVDCVYVDTTQTYNLLSVLDQSVVIGETAVILKVNSVSENVTPSWGGFFGQLDYQHIVTTESNEVYLIHVPEYL